MAELLSTGREVGVVKTGDFSLAIVRFLNPNLFFTAMTIATNCFQCSCQVWLTINKLKVSFLFLADRCHSLQGPGSSLRLCMSERRKENLFGTCSLNRHCTPRRAGSRINLLPESGP